MARFKFISCIGLVALIGLLAMPPGVMASDAWQSVSPYDQGVTTLDHRLDSLALPARANEVAVLPRAIARGLRSSFTVRKHEHVPSCVMVSIKPLLKGGALLRFT